MIMNYGGTILRVHMLHMTHPRKICRNHICTFFYDLEKNDHKKQTRNH